MHKSKLAGFIIDCRSEGPGEGSQGREDLRAAAAFWGAALGMEVRPLAGTEGETYARLIDRKDGLHIEVQTVSHPSRVHLDIETDDIEAEVRRLEALGAKRVAQVKSWWVMEAPTGHRFCVVPCAGSADFASKAMGWP
jgi:predicted enzyme related to lactoylglutathione lyase